MTKLAGKIAAQQRLEHQHQWKFAALDLVLDGMCADFDERAEGKCHGVLDCKRWLVHTSKCGSFTNSEFPSLCITALNAG